MKNHNLKPRDDFGNEKEYLKYLRSEKISSEVIELNKPVYAKHQFWAILVPFLIFLLTVGLDKAREITGVDKLKEANRIMTYTLDSLDQSLQTKQNKIDQLSDVIITKEDSIQQLTDQKSMLLSEYHATETKLRELQAEIYRSYTTIESYVDAKQGRLHELEHCFQSLQCQSALAGLNDELKKLKDILPSQ